MVVGRPGRRQRLDAVCAWASRGAAASSAFRGRIRQCASNRQSAAGARLERAVQVVPDPVALDELDDGAPGRQELRVGQVGCVHADQHARGRHRAQLLRERRALVELHHAHLPAPRLLARPAPKAPPQLSYGLTMVLQTCGRRTHNDIQTLQTHGAP